jgi:hypothetical protein
MLDVMCFCIALLTSVAHCDTIVGKIIYFSCQRKSCLYLELDSTIQAKKIFESRRTLCEFIINETLIKAGCDYVWSWIAIEPRDKVILGIRISVKFTVNSNEVRLTERDMICEMVSF